MIEKNAFDDFALEYDQWFDRHKHEYSLELKAIGMLLPETGRGIEIGAGSGRFSQPLGLSLAVEPSAAMGDLAIKRGVNIIAGSAESLPVEKNVFDFALLVTVDCFLDDPEQAYREVYRILKPGGFILIGLIDKESRLGKEYKKNKHKNKFYKHANFHSVNEIQKILEQTGFSHFEYVQTLLAGDNNFEQAVKTGYGQGSFVVMRGQKTEK